MKPGSKSGRINAQLKQWWMKDRRVWLTAFTLAGCVGALRFLGMLQAVELAAFDQVMRLQPVDAVDDRITLITIDDADIRFIQEWPIPDVVMAELLTKLKSHQPFAIGLDIYRDLPVGSSQRELQQIFTTTPNLIGIEKLEDTVSVGINAPPELAENDQVGFNNVVIDQDGKVRRMVLFWNVEGRVYRSFAMKLALMYLERENVTLQPAPGNPRAVQLGRGVLRPLQANDGGYVKADVGGYQVLAHLRSPAAPFARVSLTQVLTDDVDPELLRDRILLVGSTAASLKDFFYTSHSSSLNGNARPIAGVELHANFISQLVSSALEGRSLLRVWPDPLEWVWLLGWSWVGASLSWKIRSPGRSAAAILIGVSGLLGACYGAMLLGWWIPLVPPLLTLLGSAMVVTSYIAHLQEELKKSKEFLNSVINTIPDPVFVKDQHHRWIVLNEAYCRLIGHSVEVLLEKSDPDFFPPEEATHFWMQDDLIFTSGIETESEEQFTNADGTTYLIATKRSLHKDAAGNVFLVGVIRDITQRKQIEEELRRTAAELVRSNAELIQAKNSLTQMAYYDALTGLPNRKLFYDRLNQSLEWAGDHTQLVALLFLDLDGFKLINDTNGHQLGDLLLKAVAQRLTGCLRGSDTVARLGGDEFVVLLPAIPGPQEVMKVAQKILDTLSQNFVLQGKVLSITTSIGISLYPSDTKDIETLIQRADTAMYQAKELGKNRYEFSHNLVALADQEPLG